LSYSSVNESYVPSAVVNGIEVRARPSLREIWKKGHARISETRLVGRSTYRLFGEPRHYVQWTGLPAIQSHAEDLCQG